MAEAGGPTNVKFFYSSSSTKSAFSDKKPYLDTFITNKFIVKDLPGMNRRTFRVLGNLEQMRHHEIRLCSRGWTDKESLVHLLRMLSEHVCLRVDSHGLDAKSAGCAGDATGDFASIRDQ